MSDLQFTYERLLKIPVNELSEGLPQKTEIDGLIRERLKSLAGDGTRAACKFGENPAGVSATMACGGQEITVSGRYGQNTVFVNGRKSTFFCYSIRAESVSTSVGKMSAVGDHLILAGRIIGALTVPIPVVLAIMAFANKTGVLVVWYLPVALAVILGIWLGGRVGEAFAVRLENRAHNRAVDTGEADAAVTLWTGLKAELERISERYERI